MAKVKAQVAPPSKGERAEGYPSYKYDASGHKRYVASVEEDDALGDGWFNSPKTAAANAPAADEQAE